MSVSRTRPAGGSRASASHIVPEIAPGLDCHQRVVACPACGSETIDLVYGGGKSIHECGACGLLFQVLDARIRSKQGGDA
jgi:transcription elongation factor Elf1